MTRKDPPSVVHVLGHLDPGGVETWLLGLFAETRGRVAHTVVALGSGPGALEEAAAERGVRVVRCPLGPRAGLPGRFAAALLETSATVVHSHVHLASGGLLWLARRSGVPVRIAHGHTAADERPSTLFRRAYRTLSRHLIRRHATAGVAVASDVAAGVFGRAWADDPRWRVIPCGVDLERFAEPAAREEVRRELGFPEDAILVGQLGRFQPVKNHAFSLRVAAALAPRDPRMCFVFLGDGPTRSAAERQAGELGIDRRCAFVGRAGVSVPRFLGGLDVLLHPSLWEGLPVSLIEAQAVGLPTLASASVTREVEAVPGLVRFLDLGKGPEAWAAEVEATLSGPRPSAEEARARLAETDFDIRRSAGRFLELYGVA